MCCKRYFLAISFDIICLLASGLFVNTKIKKKNQKTFQFWTSVLSPQSGVQVPSEEVWAISAVNRTSGLLCLIDGCNVNIDIFLLEITDL